VTKTCRLCLLSRPAGENSCQICGHAEFTIAEDAIHASLAHRLISENRLDVAWAVLEDEVSTRGQSEETCRLLAWLAFAFKDARAVETWSHEGLRIAPESHEPHVVLGYAFQHAERWSEAVEEYDAAMRCPGLSPERSSLVEGLRAACLSQIPEF